MPTSNIEWKKITGTRDKLIHDYFGIDYGIVWDIIQNKIPNLDHFFEAIIVGLNAYQKKTQKTSLQEIEMANKLMQEYFSNT